jgi:hypothetical protein
MLNNCCSLLDLLDGLAVSLLQRLGYRFSAAVRKRRSWNANRDCRDVEEGKIYVIPGAQRADRQSGDFAKRLKDGSFRRTSAARLVERGTKQSAAVCVGGGRRLQEAAEPSERSAGQQRVTTDNPRGVRGLKKYGSVMVESPCPAS